MVILEQIRCPQCNRMLGNLQGHAQIKCPKCKSVVEIDTENRKIYLRKECRK